MRPEDDPSWASYARTILEFQVEGTPRVDLAQVLSPSARARFLSVGLPGCFGLLTPENPRGRRVDQAINDTRWAGFRTELADDLVQVDGLDPDSTHRERGVALPWSCERVVHLARRWDQSAIYWFDGHEMWVVGALATAPPWRLGAAA